MSPEEAKGWVDILVPIIGAGGLGGIVLAIVGAKKASSEKPAEERPSIGNAGMVQIAGMMASEHFGMQLLERLQGLNEGLRALARAKEDEARAIREAAEDRRNGIRRLCEEIDGLTDATRERRA